MEKEFEFKESPITRTLIFLIVVLFFVIFLLFYYLLPLDLFNVLTDSFNKIALGISALITIIFGPSLISKQLEKERKIKEYLDRYPHNKFNKDWEIIENEDDPPGTYYLFDKKDGTKHHILNMKTVYDLGWHIYLRYSKKIKNELFHSYPVGDRIRTQGEAGE